MSGETAFQKRITDMAVQFGWRFWHVPAPMRWTAKGWVAAREAAGLPDLVLLHDDPPRMVLAEVKGDRGRLSERQTEFLTLARDVAELSFGPAEIDDGGGIGPHVGRFPRTLGVYVFTPGMEDAIEQMLRTRVLT